MQQELSALVAHLDTRSVDGAHTWHDWRIVRVAGGANNLLYRATHPAGEYAIKFAIRDDRDRAGREYAALAALAEAGATVAPRAVWLDRARYSQPVVVQTWLHGAVLAAPPATDAAWQQLLDMYCRIHAVTPSHTTVPLHESTMSVSTGAAGKSLVAQHLARIPEHEQPRSLRLVAAWFERWEPPLWPTVPRTLCRVDSNWRNFLQQLDGLACVDWEYSGWGDPAFEWADLRTHPAYADVPSAVWERLTALYSQRMRDDTVLLRINTYTLVMRIWWVVRWARTLYEVPRGLDPRLAERPATWLADAERQYERYLAQAHEAIEQV